jgi:predicted CXXCH cytochrome family protein
VHAAAEEYEKRGGHILNPARLPDPHKAAMVCGQCHTRGKAKDGRHGYPTRGIRRDNERESVVPFQPGDDMLFTFDAGPAVHPDGSAMKHRQQYDDWLQSKHAAIGVMCWDCHDPHRHDAQYQRSQLREKGSKLCLTCHTNVTSRGIHGLHDVNSCVGCHMPTMATSANPHDIHSHTLKVVMPKTTIEAGGDLATQPNACNLCHYHQDDKPEELQAIVDHLIAEKKLTAEP